MRLSKNFTLNEMIKSTVALRKNIDNTPSQIHVENLRKVVTHILQPIRDRFDKPVLVSSGYRSIALCEAIGSSKFSQHALGQAVDFEIMGVSNLKVAMWISNNCDFDQLILEYWNGEANSGWVHCSYKNSDDNRKEYLIAFRDANGKTAYQKEYSATTGPTTEEVNESLI